VWPNYIGLWHPLAATKWRTWHMRGKFVIFFLASVIRHQVDSKCTRLKILVKKIEAIRRSNAIVGLNQHRG
jgi:hypothetical protein